MSTNTTASPVPESDPATHDEAQSLFVRAVIHELRTPLQSVQGFAELLEPGLPPAKMTQFLDILKRDLSRLVTLVDDLGLLGELTSNSLKLYQAVIPGEMVAEMLEELADTIEHENIGCSVRLNYEIDELPPVYVDDGRLHDLLHLLLSQAVEDESEIGEEINLIVRPEWDEITGERLVFMIQDNHPHIHPIHGQAIFVPMADLPKNLRRRPFGLALYIARYIALSMGGSLWLREPETSATPEGDQPSGNVFCLSVPTPVAGVDW